MAEKTMGPGGIYYVVPADQGTNGVASAFLIKRIRWIGPSAAAVTCVLQDVNGNTFFYSISDAADYIDEMHFNPPLYVMGMTVASLPSGVVMIYCQ